MDQQWVCLAIHELTCKDLFFIHFLYSTFKIEKEGPLLYMMLKLIILIKHHNNLTRIDYRIGLTFRCNSIVFIMFLSNSVINSSIIIEVHLVQSLWHPVHPISFIEFSVNLIILAVNILVYLENVLKLVIIIVYRTYYLSLI